MKKKSVKSIFSGTIYHIINTGLGLILPYLFITNLGSEANGLLNSLTQLFACLGLLEAGVGTASLQSLYKPIAEKDRDGISRVLAATNYYYKKTGIIYAVFVMAVCIFYPYLVNSRLPSSTIRLAILLQGFGAVISYFVQAKYKFFLIAEGKNYIQNGLLIVESLFRNFAKIILIALGYDIVAVQFVGFITVILEAIFIVLYIRKIYPWLNTKNALDLTVIRQKKYVFAQTLAWTIFNNTDLIVLTVFSRNLTLVSIYTVYSLVFEVIQNLINVVIDSFKYKVGNMMQQSKDALTLFFREYIIAMLAFMSAMLLFVYLLSNPFIQLYTSSAKDADYLLPFLAELFVIYKFLYAIRIICKQFIDAAGHFKQTQKISIFEASINVLLSIVLVLRIGVYGVLLGTIISLLYGVIKYIKYTGNVILKGQSKFIIKQVFIYLLPALICISGNQRFNIEVSDYLQLLFLAIIVFGGVFSIYFSIYYVQKRIINKQKSINKN